MTKLFVISLLLFSSCKDNSNANEAQVKNAFEQMRNVHQCRWPLCPYKGITNDKAAKAVANYVGDSGIDAYYIDILHIQYPTYEYDQLDSLLTH